tara:strand:- start:357 stop:545 length:189 start_codon:yes stop_codon:yes gene_type:complete
VAGVKVVEKVRDDSTTISVVVCRMPFQYTRRDDESKASDMVKTCRDPLHWLVKSSTFKTEEA